MLHLDTTDTDGDGIFDYADLDDDNDGIPDLWETNNGQNPLVADGSADTDLDGFTTREEYAAGTNPQLAISHPEGANGVNYVPFRDHFDDYQFDDRWYLASVDTDTIYSLYESGTELQGTTQPPAVACNGWQLENFATIDVIGAVFHGSLHTEGFGTTTLGLVKDQDYSNHIEVRFDNDTEPYLELHSWDNGVETTLPAAAATAYMGADVDIRVVKSLDEYYLLVDGVPQGSVTNTGLGDTLLRPFIAEESCADDAGLRRQPHRPGRGVARSRCRWAARSLRGCRPRWCCGYRGD